jgi:hypothetical protein
MTVARIPSRKRFPLTACLLAFVCAAVAFVDARGDDTKDEKKQKGPSLVLKTNPQFGFSPARVVVSAELRGGSDGDQELYCPDVEWEWGDGTKSEASQNCPPFVAGETQITRRWTVSHVYTTAGRYQMYLRLKRGSKVVLAGSAKVEIKPGLRDLSEYDQ